jgi:hypothetical protein
VETKEAVMLKIGDIVKYNLDDMFFGGTKEIKPGAYIGKIIDISYCGCSKHCKECTVRLQIIDNNGSVNYIVVLGKDLIRYEKDI